ILNMFIFADGLEAELVHVATLGEVVFTERVDRMTLGGKRVVLPCAGVMEIRGGKIVAWGDYFDLAPWHRQAGQGLTPPWRRGRRLHASWASSPRGPARRGPACAPSGSRASRSGSVRGARPGRRSSGACSARGAARRRRRGPRGSAGHQGGVRSRRSPARR